MDSFIHSVKEFIPFCKKAFASRLRVIAHLSETRVRAKVPKATCRDRVLAGEAPRVPPETLERLNEADKVQRTQSRRQGHSTPVVAGHQHANKRPLPQAKQMPRRRVRAKTGPSDMDWMWFAEPPQKKTCKR